MKESSTLIVIWSASTCAIVPGRLARIMTPESQAALNSILVEALDSSGEVINLQDTEEDQFRNNDEPELANVGASSGFDSGLGAGLDGGGLDNTVLETGLEDLTSGADL